MAISKKGSEEQAMELIRYWRTTEALRAAFRHRIKNFTAFMLSIASGMNTFPRLCKLAGIFSHIPVDNQTN